jgi:hypothetical protein
MARIHADLHLHTTCSDGRLAPAALVATVAEAGVRVMAVTDHDTVRGLDAARAEAKRRRLTFVAGVELSVTVDATEVHMLAYGFDPAHDGLRRHLDAFRTARAERAAAMTRALTRLGAPVSMADVEAAADGAIIGRPHVADAIVARGHAATMQEAFDRYIARGQPAYVAKPRVPARDALDLVHDAGGVGVLAHPGHATGGWLLQTLVNAGLDGLEVYHPSHDALLVDYYRRMAEAFGLVMTGGSDYHARGPESDARLGRIGLTEAAWERLRPAVT